MRILVAYYSRTGNTKFVAKKIADQLNADLCEIVDKKNRKGRLILLTGGFAALREKLTEIDVAKSIDDYDLIIIGTPVWAGKITPAIRTFIARNNFSDKQVAFFVTLGGEKPEKPLKNLKKTISTQLPVSELGILNNLDDPERIDEQIIAWCNELPT